MNKYTIHKATNNKYEIWSFCCAANEFWVVDTYDNEEKAKKQLYILNSK